MVDHYVQAVECVEQTLRVAHAGFGTPWYKPTRVLHVTSGSEFGWRTGSSSWSPGFADNLPAVLNIGQGSPTGVFHGRNARFPDKYQKALFIFDWSFGIIYAVHLKPDGASYTATAEEFLSGSPLPLTDGLVGPDGAMYFLTGGRQLESDLYRVSYGDNPNKKVEWVANKTIAEVNEVAKLRRSLETYHGQPQKGAVEAAWAHLKHPDRFVRYAARIAVEHQPVGEWQEKALKEADPAILTQASIALARHGKKDVKNGMLQALTKVDYTKLSEAQQIDLLRAFEVIFYRMGKPEGATKEQVVAFLNPHYPAKTNALNRSLSKVLVYIEAPGAVEKTLSLLANAKDDPSEKTVSASSDLIMRNPQYGLDIAKMLSKVPPRPANVLRNRVEPGQNRLDPRTARKILWVVCQSLYLQRRGQLRRLHQQSPADGAEQRTQSPVCPLQLPFRRFAAVAIRQ